jgi:hypothetical protein
VRVRERVVGVGLSVFAAAFALTELAIHPVHAAKVAREVAPDRMCKKGRRLTPPPEAKRTFALYDRPLVATRWTRSRVTC